MSNSGEEKVRRESSSCLVVTYHYIRDIENTPFRDLKALRVDDFEKQLDFLASNYEMIDYNTFLAGLTNTKSFPGKCCLLTFDDGFIEQYEVIFPRLVSRGLHGVFFVATAPYLDKRVLKVHQIHFLMAYMGGKNFTETFYDKLYNFIREANVNLPTERRKEIYRYDDDVAYSVKHFLNYELPYEQREPVLDEMFASILGDERDFVPKLYLSASHLLEMNQANMTIGGHSHTHNVLTKLSAKEAKGDLGKCFTYLSALLLKKSLPFCYPYGHVGTYDDKTMKILNELGFRLSFTVGREEVSFPSHNLFQLPRFDTADLYPANQ